MKNVLFFFLEMFVSNKLGSLLSSSKQTEQTIEKFSLKFKNDLKQGLVNFFISLVLVLIGIFACIKFLIYIEENILKLENGHSILTVAYGLLIVVCFGGFVWIQKRNNINLSGYSDTLSSSKSPEPNIQEDIVHFLSGLNQGFSKAKKQSRDSEL